MVWPSDRGLGGRSGGRRFDSRLPDGFDSGLPGVGSGSLFSKFWDVLGCVWEGFGDVFGWVWDGFEKMSERVEKQTFPKMAGSTLPALGYLKNNMFSLPLAKNIEILKNVICHTLAYISIYGQAGSSYFRQAGEASRLVAPPVADRSATLVSLRLGIGVRSLNAVCSGIG